MKLLLSSISLLLVVACSFAINNQQVQAQQIIPNFDTAQNRTSDLERALNRGDIREAVARIEATWENQYEGYFKTNFVNGTISDRTVSSTLNRLARTTGKKTALIYLIPQQQQLEIVVVFPGSKPIYQRVKQANNRALLAKVQ